MKVTDFDYSLKNQIVAQAPCPIRDQSRLMILSRETGQMQHRVFQDLPGLIDPGSLLVLNNSRVFPARLRGEKGTGGKAEILLLNRFDSFRWEVLLKGKFVENQNLFFRGGLTGRVVETFGQGKVLIEFKEDEKAIQNHFLQYGEVPLPPYIKRNRGELMKNDSENYQTVFAKSYGSVAAPTAGLHFTPSLLKKIEEKGIQITFVTLHVGYGTFKGISCDEVENHRMEPEFYFVSDETAQMIQSAKSRKSKIIAVGTTTTRVLETISTSGGKVVAGSGTTDLFIFPGYTFKMIDALVTNFHLPKSTLLFLAAAFAGRDRLLKAYEAAINRGYRFYSFGDAMLIL